MVLVPPKQYTVTVTKIIAMSPTTKLFRLAFPAGTAFLFTAGQFVTVHKTTASGEVKRSFSIASKSSDTSFIELLIRKKEGGALTPWFHGISEGTQIVIKGPYGLFNIKHNDKDIVFIAAGAGVAPFRGMIYNYLEHGGIQNITLIFGFRSKEDFFFREDLEALMKKYPNFHLIPAASQPSENWKGERGRVIAILSKHLTSTTNKDVYVCGPQQMITDTVQALKQIGFTSDQIFFERWD